MTDGIIQNVFNKWYKDKIERRRLEKIYWEDIKAIEEELIQKIEESFIVKESIVNHKGLPTGLFHIEDIIMKLIGESK